MLVEVPVYGTVEELSLLVRAAGGVDGVRMGRTGMDIYDRSRATLVYIPIDRMNEFFSLQKPDGLGSIANRVVEFE